MRGWSRRATPAGPTARISSASPRRTTTSRWRESRLRLATRRKPSAAGVPAADGRPWRASEPAAREQQGQDGPEREHRAGEQGQLGLQARHRPLPAAGVGELRLAMALQCDDPGPGRLAFQLELAYEPGEFVEQGHEPGLVARVGGGRRQPGHEGGEPGAQRGVGLRARRRQLPAQLGGGGAKLAQPLTHVGSPSADHCRRAGYLPMVNGYLAPRRTPR